MPIDNLSLVLEPSQCTMSSVSRITEDARMQTKEFKRTMKVERGRKRGGRVTPVHLTAGSSHAFTFTLLY